MRIKKEYEQLRRQIPHEGDNLHVSFPIDESLPNELLAEVRGLAVGIIPQGLYNKLSLILCQELGSFRILGDC